MLWKFNSVYNPGRQLADHRRPVKYEIGLPKHGVEPLVKSSRYVHHPQPAANAAT
jgi:magnesium-protoporphyrin IX monomethyl ester (oxidative) cyclase